MGHIRMMHHCVIILPLIILKLQMKDQAHGQEPLIEDSKSCYRLREIYTCNQTENLHATHVNKRKDNVAVRLCP